MVLGDKEVSSFIPSNIKCGHISRIAQLSAQNQLPAASAD